MRPATLFSGVWLAGYEAGVGTLYVAGPTIGRHLRATGDRLTAMDRPGDAIVLDGTVAADLHQLAQNPPTIYRSPSAGKPVADSWGRK